MRSRNVAMVLGLVALAVHGERAEACDRMTSPFENPHVGLAAADVVVVVDVVARDGSDDATRATVKVVDVLKGAVTAGSELVVAGVGDDLAPTRCGPTVVEVGKRYLLALFAPANRVRVYTPIHEVVGIQPHGRAVEQAWRAAIATRHPHSAWQTHRTGLAAQLVLAPDRDDDLVVVLRNTSDRSVTLDRKSWPRAAMSHCTLDVVNVATKRRIAPRDVPIPKAEIAKYFQRNPRAFTVKLAPGEVSLVHLARVTSAERGRGYKEDLGFVYYPVATAGDHTVAATCWNFVGRNSKIGTAGISLPLSR